MSILEDMGDTTNRKENPMTTMTTTEIEIVKRAAANASAKRLARWIKRFDKWMTLCEDLSDARQNYGTNSPQYAAALAAWEKGSMPSEKSKWTAYEDGRSIVRFLNATGHDIREYHKSVDELRLTLDFFTFTSDRSEVK